MIYKTAGVCPVCIAETGDDAPKPLFVWSERPTRPLCLHCAAPQDEPPPDYAAEWAALGLPTWSDLQASNRADLEERAYLVWAQLPEFSEVGV